jgi:hypothetical protein
LSYITIQIQHFGSILPFKLDDFLIQPPFFVGDFPAMPGAEATKRRRMPLSGKVADGKERDQIQ